MNTPTITYKDSPLTEGSSPFINKYQYERAIGKRRQPWRDRRWGKHAAQQGQPGCFGKSSR